MISTGRERPHRIVCRPSPGKSDRLPKGERLNLTAEHSAQKRAVKGEGCFGGVIIERLKGLMILGDLWRNMANGIARAQSSAM